MFINRKKSEDKFCYIFKLIIYILISLVLAGCSTFKIENESQKLELDTEVTVEKLSQEYETNAVDKNGGINEVDKKLSYFFSKFSADNKDFIDLSLNDKKYLLGLSHTAINDHFSSKIFSDKKLFLKEYNNIDNKVIVYLRINGQKRGSGLARENNLSKSVYAATRNALKDKRYVDGISSDDVSEIKVEIYIIGPEKELDSGYEKGIHGLRLENKYISVTYCNNIAIEGNYKLNVLLKMLCLEAGLKEDCINDPGTKFFYFPTIHFATTDYSDDITVFYRCNELNYAPSTNLSHIEESLEMAEKWMENNLNEAGYFNYQYYPASGYYSENNNMVRQLMSSRWLAQKSNTEPLILKLHEKNLEYIFDNWYRETGNYGYIYFEEKSQLGAIAMALRTLVYSPLFDKYKDKAEKLANTILFLQDSDGSLKPWYIEPDYAYDEVHLMRFYSGESILSLVELFDKTGEKKYFDAALLSQDYYMDFYKDTIDINYFPAFVPWHTISLNKIFKITNDNKYRDALFLFNDKLIKMQNQSGHPYVDFLGRFYDPEHAEYGVPHSASTGVYTEGLCYAYEIAARSNEYERMFEYKKAVFLGAHNLINLQFNGPDMYYIQNPERVEGAIRTSEDNSSIRVDNTQHMIDAFHQILSVFN